MGLYGLNSTNWLSFSQQPASPENGTALPIQGHAPAVGTSGQDTSPPFQIPIEDYYDPSSDGTLAETTTGGKGVSTQAISLSLPTNRSFASMAAGSIFSGTLQTSGQPVSQSADVTRLSVGVTPLQNDNGTSDQSFFPFDSGQKKILLSLMLPRYLSFDDAGAFDTSAVLTSSLSAAQEYPTPISFLIITASSAKPAVQDAAAVTEMARFLDASPADNTNVNPGLLPDSVTPVIVCDPSAAEVSFSAPFQHYLTPLSNEKDLEISFTFRNAPLETVDFDRGHVHAFLFRLLSCVAANSPRENKISLTLESCISDQQNLWLSLVLKTDSALLFDNSSSLSVSDQYAWLARSLAYCHDLAALLGGNLLVQNSENSGTSFYVKFPVKWKQQSRKHASVGRFSGRHLLFADLCTGAGDHIPQLLRRREILLDAAKTKSDLLHLLGSNPPGYYSAAIITADAATIRDLRQSNCPDAWQIPILALLPSSEAEKRGELLRAGCDCCLDSTCSAQELYYALDLLLI